MSDAFTNNPFQNLARQWSGPDRTAKPARASQGKPKRTKPDVSDCEELSSEDQTLFLRAVGRLADTRFKPTVPPLQTVGEQLQEADQRMKKRKAKKLAHQKIAEPEKASRKDAKTTAVRTCVTQGDELTMEQALAGTAKEAVSEKEWQAFLRAVDGVQPLNEQRGRIVVPESRPQPPTAVSVDFASLVESRLEFQLFCRDEYLEGQIAGLDQLIMDKLRSGNLSPEAHLDLHGFTVVQAFEALRGFIKLSWYKGLRNLLIIPGRGHNSLDGIGVLRGRLPQWLTQEPLKRVVLAFCTAIPADGGPGSIYVLLRKYRKKGRVFWERLPDDEELF